MCQLGPCALRAGCRPAGRWFAASSTMPSEGHYCRGRGISEYIRGLAVASVCQQQPSPSASVQLAATPAPQFLTVPPCRTSCRPPLAPTAYRLPVLFSAPLLQGKLRPRAAVVSSMPPWKACPSLQGVQGSLAFRAWLTPDSYAGAGSGKVVSFPPVGAASGRRQGRLAAPLRLSTAAVLSLVLCLTIGEREAIAGYTVACSSLLPNLLCRSSAQPHLS